MRPTARPETLSLEAPEPDPARLPRYLTKRQIAELHRRYWGPYSERTAERAPFSWRIVNGYAVAPTTEVIDYFQKRFSAAPVMRGGSRAGTEAA